MKEMTIAATVENIGAVTDFVDEQLEALDCPMKAQMQINIEQNEAKIGSVVRISGRLMVGFPAV